MIDPCNYNVQLIDFRQCRIKFLPCFRCGILSWWHVHRHAHVTRAVSLVSLFHEEKSILLLWTPPSRPWGGRGGEGVEVAEDVSFALGVAAKQPGDGIDVPQCSRCYWTQHNILTFSFNTFYFLFRQNNTYNYVLWEQPYRSLTEISVKDLWSNGEPKIAFLVQNVFV